jgi:hypothetical protein
MMISTASDVSAIATAEVSQILQRREIEKTESFMGSGSSMGSVFDQFDGLGSTGTRFRA